MRLISEAREARNAEWDAQMAIFHQEWGQMKASPRVLIQLPSLSFSPEQRASLPNLDVRQNAQLPRLCAVRELGVDLIYVSPFPLNEDVAHYFAKVVPTTVTLLFVLDMRLLRTCSPQVLEIGGIDEPTKRYKIVVPENYHRFPSHFSLTTCLLYSPRALRRITNFCRGKRGKLISTPQLLGREAY